MMNTLKIPKDFEKIPKLRKHLENCINRPIIMVTKDDLILACNIDDYESRGIAVYNIEILKDSQWQPQKEWYIEYDGKTRPDDFRMFDLDEIDVIYGHKNRELSLYEVQHIFIDPTYEPFGIDCKWNHNNNHSPDCNKELHEALSNIFTNAYRGIDETDKDRFRIKRKELDESIELVTRKLWDCGYKIP